MIDINWVLGEGKAPGAEAPLFIGLFRGLKAPAPSGSRSARMDRASIFFRHEVGRGRGTTVDATAKAKLNAGVLPLRQAQGQNDNCLVCSE